MQQESDVVFGTNPTVIAGARDHTLARWISNVACPPVLAVLAVMLCAASVGTRPAWLGAAVYVSLTVLGPTAYILWLVYRGDVSDIHLRVREQRIKPLLVTLSGAVLALLVLVRSDEAQLLVALAAANLVQTILFLLITMRWKISLHTAAAAGLAALGLFVLGSAALGLVLMVPLIAWARVRLRRHTLAQTIAGGVLGSSVMFLAIGAANWGQLIF